MRRLTLALAFVALGCKPDVHIHVHDDDGDDTDATATDSGFSDSGNSGGGDSNASNDTNDPSASASDSADPTTDSDTADPTTGDDSSAGDSSGGGDSNPYPQPSDGACPEGLGYNADGNFDFCGPPCGEGNSCPPTETGNVLVQCVFNPESSMAACQSAMCEDPEETCFAGACMLPATHCAPMCSTADAVCPDGMECTTNDVCRFPM